MFRSMFARFGAVGTTALSFLLAGVLIGGPLYAFHWWADQGIGKVSRWLHVPVAYIAILTVYSFMLSSMGLFGPSWLKSLEPWSRKKAWSSCLAAAAGTAAVAAEHARSEVRMAAVLLLAGMFFAASWVVARGARPEARPLDG